MNMKTGDRLRMLRKSRGLTQEQLSLRLGIARQTISNHESGASNAGVDDLQKYADLYGVSVDEILGRDQVNSGKPPMSAGLYQFQSNPSAYPYPTEPRPSRREIDTLRTVAGGHTPETYCKLLRAMRLVVGTEEPKQ